MIYNRPVFNLFKEDDQKIASRIDPVDPVFDDGSQQAGTHPSGTLNALDYGKLLASGEAGYYDIQKQSHETERKNKPIGQGIAFKYPNPPDPQSSSDFNFEERHSYWGLPSGENKGYYQSGIFVKGNDHREGETLDYYYQDSGKQEISRSENEPFQTNISLHSGIFNFDGYDSKFSSGFGQSTLSRYWSKQGNTYIPRSNTGFGFKLGASVSDAVAMNSSVSAVAGASASGTIDSEDGVSVAANVYLIFDEKLDIEAIKITDSFVSTEGKGKDFSLDGAIIKAVLDAISFQSGLYRESGYNLRRFTRSKWMKRIGQKLQWSNTAGASVDGYVKAGKKAAVGRIILNNFTLEKGIYSVSVNVEIVADVPTTTESTLDRSIYAPAIVTNDLILIHKGSGEPLEPISIPYLGDYKVVESQKDNYIKAESHCGEELTSSIEEYLEGKEIIPEQPEDEEEETI